MDFRQKARIRLEHWISHNDHHEDEYLSFVEELESAGMEESGKYVKEMIAHTSKGTEALKKALKALG